MQLPLRRKAVYLVPPDVAAKAAAKAARDQAEASAEAEAAAQPTGDPQAAPAEQPEPHTPRVVAPQGECPSSPFADAPPHLDRPSTGAASLARTSQSSGAGSALDSTLLRPGQQAKPSSAAPASPGSPRSRAEAGPAARPRTPLRRRLYRWLARFVLRPVFGYDPDAIQGEWMPPDGYDAK